MQDNKILSVTGWQLTTQQYIEIEAEYFADCSGDSVLAPLTGAEYRVGREAEKEFGEDIAPKVQDTRTMGMSCMIQARQENTPSTFIAPSFARKITKEDLVHRMPNLQELSENFWYLELGGEQDSIHDTENIRHELLSLAYGVWDYLKNDAEQREKNANWRLDWMGILPGKRESRRYVGDYIMTQNHVRSEGKFEDLVAYGGWSMDDHHPKGFNTKEKPTIFHPAPSPFGIPYRCLYSKNIQNLFFAGRNISVTHAAMSATRVMGTCAIIGQAMGTAVSIAHKNHISPRKVYEDKIQELRESLMEDDCYLPFTKRTVPPLTQNATLVCDAPHKENLRNGFDRPIQKEENYCALDKNQSAYYSFSNMEQVSFVRLVFDSDLNRTHTKGSPDAYLRNMLANRPLSFRETGVPNTMVKAFKVEVLCKDDEWKTLFETHNNYQRLKKIDISMQVKGVKLTVLETWGTEKCNVFSFDVY